MYLLASDFDGTLAIKNEEIRIEDLSKIKSFIDLGHHFVLVSGRTVKSLTRVCKTNNFKCSYIIACSGSYIVNQNGDCLYESLIDTKTYFKIMEIVKGSNYISHTLCNGYEAGLAMMVPYKQHPFSTYNRDLSDFVTIEEIVNDKITQANFLYRDLNEVDEVAKKLSSIKEISVHLNGLNIDITASDASKAKAISELNKINNYQKIYTIGDGLNDLDMIKNYYGFAMNNGNDILKKEAKQVVNNISECLDLMGVLK